MNLNDAEILTLKKCRCPKCGTHLKSPPKGASVYFCGALCGFFIAADEIKRLFSDYNDRYGITYPKNI